MGNYIDDYLTRTGARSLLRIAKDLREFVGERTNDPDAMAVLKDVETLEQVGNWLVSTTPIFSSGIPSTIDCEKASEPTSRKLSI